MIIVIAITLIPKFDMLHIISTFNSYVITHQCHIKNKNNLIQNEN